MRASRFGKTRNDLGHESASRIDPHGYRLLNLVLWLNDRPQQTIALLLFLGICAWFWVPLVKLSILALENENFSHVLLIPALTLYLLFLNRTAILDSRRGSPLLGLLIMLGGAFGYWLADGQDWPEDHLTVVMITFVVMCWGLFLLMFGAECFHFNVFAMIMLLFMIPWPSFILGAIIGFLQRSSAEAVDVLLSVLCIPVVREGFLFELSNFTIMVAQECSGIRSFIALVITSLVAGHWFLTSGWAKTALVLAVVPLAIIKNAFRIVGLALLANYVDPTYITNSALHRSGGIPLFLFSLVVLLGIVLILRRWEGRLTIPSGSVRDGLA